MQYCNNIELSHEKIRCQFSGSKTVIKLGIDVRQDLFVFCQTPSARLKGEKLFAKNSRQPVKTANRNIESPIRVPQMPSTFHPLAQRNAFRRCDVGLKSRPFARWNQWLRSSPNSIRP